MKIKQNITKLQSISGATVIYSNTHLNPRMEFFGVDLQSIAKTSTSKLFNIGLILGNFASFSKTFIIRGIGYRANILQVDQEGQNELKAFRLLSVRVGHSFHLFKPIPNYIGLKISKKDRKLVVYGINKVQVINFAKIIFKLRPPSVYTGRGIRFKKTVHRRKLGKKDTRKGRFF